MSINYYDLSQPPQWWPEPPPEPEFPPTDRLFEKPLTPSDVGKLNRLVIPKQHAEKHFPLNSGADSGLLLAFEDEVGKPWRFRYSYWNSSQSYVLTKGWSRFVKEKNLDAGDVVVFARHRLDPTRLFIGWRRRSGNPVPHYHHPIPGPSVVEQQAVVGGGNSRWLRLFGVNMECPNESNSGESSQYC